MKVRIVHIRERKATSEIADVTIFDIDSPIFGRVYTPTKASAKRLKDVVCFDSGENLSYADEDRDNFITEFTVGREY